MHGVRWISIIGLPLLILLSGILSFRCGKSEETPISFTNPLDNCISISKTNKSIVYDHINNLSFKLEPQWKLTFNNQQNVTSGIDTVASDNHSLLRTFTITTISSKLSLSDFFVEELQFMKKDSTVNILLLGKYTVDNQPALYSIVKMKEGILVIKMVFFYVKIKDKICVIQLGINENESIEGFCSTMYIVNSLDFESSLIISELSEIK